MMTLSEKIIRLLERRRMLEGELYEVNQQLNTLEVNPYTAENRDYGFPYNILWNSIQWGLTAFERFVRSIVNRTLR